jgi:hypothetical protein
MLCESCYALRINGLLCHEHGCPDAHKTETRECKWCGNAFAPEDRGQRFCDDDCTQSYWG